MKNNTLLYTHILGGNLKGQKILLPSLTSTRSTKNLLKKSFFDTFQFRLHDRLFIELFAGSGSMGIEAVSRGAKEALFFEADKAAFKTLGTNIEKLIPLQGTRYFGDTFLTSQSIIEQKLTLNSYKAILYCDPPFSIREGFENIYASVVTYLSNLNAPSFEALIIEHDSNITFNEQLGGFIKTKTKVSGKSSLSYYEASSYHG